ncbi:MAG: hypothetical protein M3R38_13745 [Actinomycetota bacterium]|nr:hypothetical protein [Actinomycetota bacterium]
MKRHPGVCLASTTAETGRTGGGGRGRVGGGDGRGPVRDVGILSPAPAYP